MAGVTLARRRFDITKIFEADIFTMASGRRAIREEVPYEIESAFACIKALEGGHPMLQHSPVERVLSLYAGYRLRNSKSVSVSRLSQKGATA
jgi:hypothetical protein